MVEGNAGRLFLAGVYEKKDLDGRYLCKECVVGIESIADRLRNC